MKTRNDWLFVSDVDDTLLGDDEALAELMSALANLPNIITVYNSSRPCSSLRASLSKVEALATPDYLVGALGTEIETGQSAQRLEGYTASIAEGWDIEKVRALVESFGLPLHDAQYLTPMKISADLVDKSLYPQIKDALSREGIRCKLVYSGGKNLDFIPIRAGKVSAIHYLYGKLGIAREHVIVAGDGENDLDMFEASLKGIVVGNASPTLRAIQSETVYQAEAPYARGLLEGLLYWGVLSSSSAEQIEME